MLRFAEVFGECEAIVAPSSSCVGTVRELYPAPLGIDDPVTQRVFELSEFLVNELEVEDVGASFAHTVAYHPTCHYRTEPGRRRPRAANADCVRGAIVRWRRTAARVTARERGTGGRLRRPGGVTRRVTLELAAGAVEPGVRAVAGGEQAERDEGDEEEHGGHALMVPCRDYQRKSCYCGYPS